MATERKGKLLDILKRNENEILSEWAKEQVNNISGGISRIKEGELQENSRNFLRLLIQALSQNDSEINEGTGWRELKELLSEISSTRGIQGFSPSETAMFVFSFKKPLFSALRRELNKDAELLADESWRATELIDKLGLFTTEVHQKSREELINRQQMEMMELSTPVVKLWGGILALPLIGTLDSARTQIVMENLLQKIVETEADVAIIDITGVPTVDTLVAQHLIKTVTAARLMGADCIISGIRPQIAQTIVHLGVDLGNVITKASLADALLMALKNNGYVVTRTQTIK